MEKPNRLIRYMSRLLKQAFPSSYAALIRTISTIWMRQGWIIELSLRGFSGLKHVKGSRRRRIESPPLCARMLQALINSRWWLLEMRKPRGVSVVHMTCCETVKYCMNTTKVHGWTAKHSYLGWQVSMLRLQAWARLHGWLWTIVPCTAFLHVPTAACGKQMVLKFEGIPFQNPDENVAWSAKWKVHIWNWLRECHSR